MATVERDLKAVEMTREDLWTNGPPYELFKELRGGCPLHWTEGFELFPEEAGFWSGTTADDIHTVSRDWQTYSSARRGGVAAPAPSPSGWWTACRGARAAIWSATSPSRSSRA